MKHLKRFYESIEDVLIPEIQPEVKTEEKPEIKINLNNILDISNNEFINSEFTDMWDFGLMTNLKLQKEYDGEIFFNHILDGENDNKPFPLVYYTIKIWLKINYPKIDESEIEEFFDGLSSNKIYM